MAIAELLDHLRLEFPDSLAAGLVERQVCSARDLLNADIEQLRDDGILPQRHCRRLARYVLRNGRHFPPLPVVSSDEGSPPRPAHLGGSPHPPPPPPPAANDIPISDLTNEVLLENKTLKDDNIKLRNIIASLEANLNSTDLQKLKEQQEDEQDRLRELTLQQELEEIQLRRMEKLGKMAARNTPSVAAAVPLQPQAQAAYVNEMVGGYPFAGTPGNTSSVTSPIRPPQISSSFQPPNMLMRDIPSQLSSHLNAASAAIPIDPLHVDPMLAARAHLPSSATAPTAVPQQPGALPTVPVVGVDQNPLFQNGYNLEDRRRANTGRLKQMGMHIEQQQREVEERAMRLRDIEDKLRYSRQGGNGQIGQLTSGTVNASNVGGADIRGGQDLSSDHRLVEAMRRIELRTQSGLPPGASPNGLAYSAAAEARIQSRLNNYAHSSDTVDHIHPGGIFRH